ncbi:MAG: signal peptide peptidase SppA [Planctomycetia bacterium]
MESDSHQPPTRVILEQASLWGRWGGRVAWLIAGIAVIVALASIGANAQYFQKDAKVVEQYHSLSKAATSKVAVVDISGPIMGGGGFARSQLDRIAEDDDVKAIVLRIDSPGGTVSGSDEIHYRISELAKARDLPVVVSMGGIAASGGYYIAMANGGRDDVIFAEPATLTGSIGVIIPHFDISKLVKKLDIEDDSIASGPLKQMLSPTRDRTPEIEKRERKILQDLVDEMFSRFKQIVKQGRPKIDDEKLAAVTTGQIFTAQQAQDSGLVDRIGFIEDAVARAVELAGLSKETARVVKYSKPRGLLDELLGGSAPGSRQMTMIEAVAELSTPRAWYLCSWWPPVVTTVK